MTSLNYGGVWYMGEPYVNVDDLLRIATNLKIQTAIQVLSAIRKDMSGRERVLVREMSDERGPVEPEEPIKKPEEKPMTKTRIKEDGYF